MDKPTIDFYNQHAKTQSDLYEAADMSVMYRRLEAVVPPHSRILEIGCGSGRDARALADMGFSVVATDASNGMIQEAKRRAEGKRGDLSFVCLPFPIPEGLSLFKEQRFDLVLAVAVLMHMLPEERVQTLKQIQRTLKPNGLFYCTFKKQQSKDVRLYQEICSSDLESECLHCGLQKLFKWEDVDMLGRDTCWTSALFVKGASEGFTSLACEQLNHGCRQ